jgi:tetratricopeptide (TPR) repeat protein
MNYQTQQTAPCSKNLAKFSGPRLQTRWMLAIAGTAAMALLTIPALAAQMQMPMGIPGPTSKPVLPSDLPVPEKMSGIGNIHFPISGNAEAQAWFDQGINLFYDFWDYEASRAFEQSVRADPTCAICYWGLYQSEKFRGNDDGTAYAADALKKAVELAPHATPREKLYIQAAQAQEAPVAKAGSDDDMPNQPEIGILRTLVKKNPKDTTARLLLAEAVGDGYDKDGQPRAGQKEEQSLLQSVLHDEPNNSGANHLWIHAVEASDHPEAALHSAQILGSLAPTSGHMVHMPGHIYYRVGDYAAAQNAFDASTRADETYMHAQKVDVDDDWNYVHNLMYSVANLLEQGQMSKAKEVSAKLIQARGHREDTLYPWSARDGISRLNPDLPIALRTANWEWATQLVGSADIPSSMPNLEFLAGGLGELAAGMRAVEEHLPEAAQRHSLLLDASLWRMSQEVKAEQAAKAAKDSAKNAKPAPAAPQKTQSMDSQAQPLVQALSIMSLELRASLLASQDQFPEAEKLFAMARQQEKDLGYHEPPLYIRPVAETEAAAFFQAGHLQEAKAAYQKALLERPNSGFPLYGIALVEEKSNSDAKDTAAAYHQFLTAWKSADPDLSEIKHAQQWLAAHSAESASR